MRRLFFLLLLVISLPALAYGQNSRLSGYVEQGGNVIVTSGINSTTKAQKSFPAATVTIYNTGTLTLTTLYSDAAGTPKANPFAADSTGYWFAYASPGTRVDVVFSGTGITVPFTWADLMFPGGGAAGSGITTLNTLTATTQTFAFDQTSTTPGVTSASSTHTFHFPLMAASSVTSGLLSNTTQTLPGNKTLPGDTQLGNGTNYNDPGQATLGATANAMQVAIGSAASPSTSLTPTLSIQTQDASNPGGATSVIPFLFGVRKQSGCCYFYENHTFLRMESATNRDAVAIVASIFADPASTPGVIQTNWAAQLRAERNKVGTRISGAEVDTVNTVVVALAGTITTTGTAVVGGGTTFTTDLDVGTTYLAGGQYRTVSAIADNTHLTVSVGYSPDLTNATYAKGSNAVASDSDANATFGLNIVPTGPGRNAFGIRFQLGTPMGPYITGISAQSQSIFSYFLDTKEMGAGIGLTPARPIRIGNDSYVVARNAADNADKRLFGLNSSNLFELDLDSTGARFDSTLTVNSTLVAAGTQTNKVTLDSLNSAGIFYPGIWFGSAAPSITNYSFLYEPTLNVTILNGPTAIDFRVANAAAWYIDQNRHFISQVDNTLNIGDATHQVKTMFFGTSAIGPLYTATAGSGSNAVGTDAVLAPGVSTGNAVPSLVRLKSGALGGSSGTTAQTLVDRHILGASKIVTNNTVTTVSNITDASNTSAIIVIDYGVEVFNGTDVQYEVGSVSCGVNNKAGVFTQNTCTKYGNTQGVTSGTLAVTWTITGANPALLQVNANSSLTPSTGFPRITYNLKNVGQQAVAPQ